MHKVRKVVEGAHKHKVRWSLLRHFVWEAGHYQRQRRRLARVCRCTRSAVVCPVEPP